MIEDVREDVYAVYLESEHVNARRETRINKHKDLITQNLKEYITAKDLIMRKLSTQVHFNH